MLLRISRFRKIFGEPPLTSQWHRPPGARTQGRTSTALTVATDDRPETTAGSKLSPARHPLPGRGPKLQTAGFMAVPFSMWE